MNFPLVPYDHIKGMDVCVKGEVTAYKERYQIVINTKMQLDTF